MGTPVGTVTDGAGNTIATYQNDTVTSLNGMNYNSSTNAGQDRIWVQAYAEGQWGNWTYVDMNNTGSGSGTGGGSGNSTIALTLSADGDAQFTVDVNGQQVGGTYDVTAQHGAGQTAAATQDFTLPGTFDTSGPFQLSVNFLNQADGDLYVESATFGSQTILGNQAVMNPGSTNPGADPNAAVMFEDGTATFNLNDTPPTTTILVAQEQTIGPNQTVALSNLFSANEPDGDPITQYNVYEGSFGTPVGTVTDANNNTIADYQNDTVSSLAGMTYNSSTNAGQDRLWVQAYADGQWGNWTYVDMNNTGAGSGTGGGSGNSTIALTLSSDGDAQFTVDVNGQQVNGVYDV